MTSVRQTVLSIITVTRNDCSGLESTYRSLRSQTIEPHLVQNIEWVVIDGASTDNTNELLSSIKFFGKFLYISEPDSGIFDAMNKGVGLASGSHLLFLNAGDALAGHDVLSFLLKLVGANPDKIIAGRVNMHWDGYSCISDLAPWVCHQSVMTPKIILDKYPFDSYKKYFGDLHLWLRLKRDGIFNVQRTDTIVCDFYLGGVGNNPENLWGRLKERHQLSNEFGAKIPYSYRLAYTLALVTVWKLFGKTCYYRAIWLISGMRYHRS